MLSATDVSASRKGLIIIPFPPADDLMQIVAKVEIAHDEQFLLWLQYFQLYITFKLFFKEIFQVFVFKVV